jgi:NADH-quinone oxidoreductase subunit J
MPDILFYIFALMTLGCGLLVVANPFSRNPVTCAMFLVLSMVSMAGLFVLLHAFFLAAVQILVYAGAVMVLFLFVIMLLDLKEEERQKARLFAITSGLASVGGLVIILVRTIWVSGSARAVKPTLEGGTTELGRMLFNYHGATPGYLLPFEIVSLLLLVAMVGVIVLSRRDAK